MEKARSPTPNTPAGIEGPRSTAIHPTPAPWQTLSTRYLKRSPWRNVRVDRVRLHTGSEIEYTYLETPPAVFVVPLLGDGRVVLIRQYRHPVRDWVWEVPAGSIGDESPEETARRELREEIGGTCAELVPLGWFYSSSAHLTLKSYPFLAVGVELGASRLEETELLQVVPTPADEVLRRVRAGAFGGGQSALSLLLAEPRIRAHLAGADRRDGAAPERRT